MPSMPTVAEQLRRAREEQNLNIYQIAEITKIKTDHIRALEEGSYDSFSAPVYIRGFVRTYAKALKLDINRVTADLEGELSKTKRFREPPPLTDRPRTIVDFLTLQLSKLNWRILAGAIVGILLIAGLGIWLRSCHSRAKKDPLRKLGPGIYQPKQDGETLPVPAPSAPRPR
jgi:cytoskeletal protein RodZ